MKLHFSLFLFFGVIGVSTPVLSQRTLGLIFDDEAYEKQARVSRSFKFSDFGPTVGSLRPFCPVPGNQGEMGSCVGWASAYGAMTIATALQQGISDIEEINALAKSSLYVYNQIRKESCRDGSQLTDAMALLKEKGVCKLEDFDPPTCTVLPTSREHIKAQGSKIKEYSRLFDVKDQPEQKIISTINSLKSKKPVVIGMVVTNSLAKLEKPGIWIPSENDEFIGGHAMCVVGYDNEKEMFEIMNSWGTEFGDKGFMFVPYEVYGLLCVYGFQFSIEAPNPSQPFSFKGSFYLSKLSIPTNERQRINPSKKGIYYELSPGVIRYNDYFKVMASGLEEGNYLYIFSVHPDGKGEVLFPTMTSRFAATLTEVPIVPSDNSYFELPSESNLAYQANKTGIDYLIFLYSKKRIDDIASLVGKVEGTLGDIDTRINKIFGERLIPESDIRYTPGDMSFSGTSSKGHIVPIILRVPVTN